jgi:hypothetical protein
MCYAYERCMVTRGSALSQLRQRSGTGAKEVAAVAKDSASSKDKKKTEPTTGWELDLTKLEPGKPTPRADPVIVELEWSCGPKGLKGLLTAKGPSGSLFAMALVGVLSLAGGASFGAVVAGITVIAGMAGWVTCVLGVSAAAAGVGLIVYLLRSRLQQDDNEPQ